MIPELTLIAIGTIFQIGTFLFGFFVGSGLARKESTNARNCNSRDEGDVFHR